jgi:DDE superfamily endonuclease
VVKKRHCVKNVLISDDKQRVLYLSPTYCGSVHDKTIADEQDFQFQRTIDLLQDTGFQGFKPKNANIIQPLKKPKGKELTPEQKESNKGKSKIRVVVEHSIRGVKIWRMAKDVCRTWKHGLRDYQIFIACGLHNFRLRARVTVQL